MIFAWRNKIENQILNLKCKNQEMLMEFSRVASLIGKMTDVAQIQEQHQSIKNNSKLDKEKLRETMIKDIDEIINSLEDNTDLQGYEISFRIHPVATILHRSLY